MVAFLPVFTVLCTAVNSDFVYWSTACFAMGLAVFKNASFFCSAGGDTACLVGPTHSDPDWTALQHGLSATFALAPWQFAGEGVDEEGPVYQPISQ